ncbi:uncharacterized protein V1510DRAFT_401120 [Dipodascopsis tothii]|uniref:uncharacterized protein n=1 Tax=Dipodascopsis tothii TaxID=44089 RepID=UPI0034CF3C48
MATSPSNANSSGSAAGSSPAPVPQSAAADASPAELARSLQSMLDELNQKFTAASKEIVDKMDVMAKRIDQLERKISSNPTILSYLDSNGSSTSSGTTGTGRS